ncbi:hypothetical protein [Vibrio campbellii]|uniref:hypothetical protein n=1 Tax=Vibrio campbellii TaxID=680 RepID=UPI001E3CBC84|nr:hypothetical protein [Vibrio campbellii]
MKDIMLKLAYFTQRITLNKNDYEYIGEDELSVVFRYNNSVLCRPYIYFRPVNISSALNEHEFTETMFECYEGNVEIVSQTFTEFEDRFRIVTRYGMVLGDTNGEFSGCEFTYRQDNDNIFKYQVENSIAPEDECCTPLNPLELSVNGTLECEVVEEPLVGSFLCPN